MRRLRTLDTEEEYFAFTKKEVIVHILYLALNAILWGYMAVSEERLLLHDLIGSLFWLVLGVLTGLMMRRVYDRWSRKP